MAASSGFPFCVHRSCAMADLVNSQVLIAEENKDWFTKCIQTIENTKLKINESEALFRFSGSSNTSFDGPGPGSGEGNEYETQMWKTNTTSVSDHFGKPSNEMCHELFHFYEQGSILVEVFGDSGKNILIAVYS